MMTRKDQQEQSQSGSSLSGLMRPSTHQKNFTFTQPLFSGFKEFAAVRGAGAEKRGKQQDLLRAQQLLMVDVSESFYTVMQVRRDIEILESTVKILEDRMKELDERVRLGRSRESERQANLTDLKTVGAGLTEYRRLEAITLQILEFYVGRSVTEKLIEDTAFDEGASLEHFLGKADKRPDVQSAKESLVLQEQGVVVAQAGLFPTISASGNYYSQRQGPYDGIDWDLMLTFDVPIFDGAQTFGNIKQAVAQRKTQELVLSRTERQAALDIKNAYENYHFSKLSENAYQQATQAAQENFRLNDEDYKNNLISNLELLDVLRRYKDISRIYNLAHYLTKKNYWKLKVATGEAIV